MSRWKWVWPLQLCLLLVNGLQLLFSGGGLHNFEFGEIMLIFGPIKGERAPCPNENLILLPIILPSGAFELFSVFLDTGLFNGLCFRIEDLLLVLDLGTCRGLWVGLYAGLLLICCLSALYVGELGLGVSERMDCNLVKNILKKLKIITFNATKI